MIRFFTKIDGYLKNKKSLLWIFCSLFGLNTSIYHVTEHQTIALLKPSGESKNKSSEFLYNSAIKLIQYRQGTAGLAYNYARRFIYFYYYTGNFPLATQNDTLKYSKENAYKEITIHGKSLIMEYEYWSRLGENARIFTFLPNAIIKNSPENPSTKLFNALVFLFSLMILYWGFYKIGFPLIGFLMVVSINFTPFFIYEVYANQNIFALLGCTFFIILGLNLPMLFSIQNRLLKLIFNAVLSALIIGFFSEIRNEISIVILCLILIVLVSNNIKIISKIGLILLIIFCFLGTKTGIRSFFDHKFEATSKLVRKYNGHLYTGARIDGHKFWHPVFCGLGDFDQKYGYKWEDRVAYRYAVPILKKKYNITVKYSDKYYTDDYYDKDKLYNIKFDEIPEYEIVVRDKVLSDITADPIWYFMIIIKRIIRTLTITLPIPLVGWLLFPLIYYLFRRKKWDFIKLILISLPLSATPICIFSGYGATYNSVFVYFVIAISLNGFYENRKKMIL